MSCSVVTMKKHHEVKEKVMGNQGTERENGVAVLVGLISYQPGVVFV